MPNFILEVDVMRTGADVELLAVNPVDGSTSRVFGWCNVGEPALYDQIRAVRLLDEDASIRINKCGCERCSK